MRAWLFQDARQKKALGDKCPWSVGWIDRDGHRRSKKLGAKSTAERFRKQTEAKLALDLCTLRQRTAWADFRERFAAAALAGKAEGTVAEYANALDSFERIARPVYVDTITTETVDKFKAKRLAEPCRRRVPKEQAAGKSPKHKRRPGRELEPERPTSPATVNKELRHLRAALRKAHQWKLLAELPVFEMLAEPERDPEYVDDAMFKALYDACDQMARPAGRHYPAADWWKALLCFAYMTGWRIGEILDLRRDDLDLETGVARVAAENTKGRREARVELPAIVLDHVRAILEFKPHVFDWPHHERTLWADFAELKKAAGVTFAGAFHRFRFGFANANVDKLDADLLQRLMRHQDPQTTRHYINAADRMRRSGLADRVHVPAFLKTSPAAELSVN